jgi:hypothetical protein
MAAETPRIEGPHAGLLDWLAGRHVEYELHEHPETFTARLPRADHSTPTVRQGGGVAAMTGGW